MDILSIWVLINSISVVECGVCQRMVRTGGHTSRWCVQAVIPNIYYTNVHEDPQHTFDFLKSQLFTKNRDSMGKPGQVCCLTFKSRSNKANSMTSEPSSITMVCSTTVLDCKQSVDNIWPIFQTIPAMYVVQAECCEETAQLFQWNHCCESMLNS